MQKILYIILGWIAVLVGTIGIFLPLLPTTVFLLIASYFFMKGSPKLNDKLLNNKYLGKYIRNYKENKGMPVKSKISAICLLWTSILISGFFFVDSTLIRVILLFVALGVTIHIANIKSYQVQPANEMEGS